MDPRKGAMGVTAVDQEGMKVGATGAGEIESGIISDVKDAIGWQIEGRGGELEYGRIRFGGADFTRNDDGIEEAIEVEALEKGPESFVPVREHGGADSLVPQGFESREDIGVNPPGIGLGEPGIELRKERQARRGMNEIEEHLIDQLGPIGCGMELAREGLPGGAEALVEQSGIERGGTERSGDLGIDMADGRVRVDERATDVEGHGLDRLRHWGEVEGRC